MGFFDSLKNVHKFVTDGFQRYQEFKNWTGGKLSEKEKRIQDLIQRSGVQVDNLQDIHNKEGGWNFFTALDPQYMHISCEPKYVPCTAQTAQNFANALTAMSNRFANEYPKLRLKLVLKDKSNWNTD